MYPYFIMRTYSLYLSTLTGAKDVCIFSSTVADAVMTVTAVTSGKILEGQSFVINGVVNKISAYGTGTGGTGDYTLQKSTPQATANVYLSYNDSSMKYSPSVKSNMASVKWNINWKEIFGNHTGECRLRARLISSSTTGILWVNNVGSLRLSLPCSTSNGSNGLNCGFVLPQPDYRASGATISTYLDCDASSGNGLSMIIPQNNSDLTVSLMNSYEQLMVNVPEFQLWLYFDVDE